MLNQARQQREAIAGTTQKSQALAIAKQYLKNSFISCLEHLRDTNYWRNTFDDQLNVDFREFLLNGVNEELRETNNSVSFCQSHLNNEVFQTFVDAKAPIKE